MVPEQVAQVELQASQFLVALLAILIFAGQEVEQVKP
jgi:hypothetical protein